MASPSCSFSFLLDSPCPGGLITDYPGQVEVISLRHFAKDGSGHLQLHGLCGDAAFDSECKLLLARAGKQSHLYAK